MKRILTLALSTLVLSALASATTVSCTVTTGGIVSSYATSTPDINGNTANTGARVANGGPLASTLVFNCPALSVSAGSSITNYMVLATGDYSGGPFGTTSGTQVTL